MPKLKNLIFAVMFLLAAPALGAPAKGADAATHAASVKRSNENAKILLDVMVRFNPEMASRLGIEGHDGETLDLGEGHEARERKATQDALAQLRAKFENEKDPLVREDLDILVTAADRDVRGSLIEEKYEVPYYNVALIVFSGVRGLLDDQIAAARRPMALARLKRYVGAEAGTTPLTKLAEARTREKMSVKGLLMPIKAEVEKDLANSNYYLNGASELFRKYKIEGAEPVLAKLKAQLEGYNKFVRETVLPRARTDYRLPAEAYAFKLEKVGVDLAPDALAAQAHTAFNEIQKQMQVLAGEIAKQRKLPSSDYRDVIRVLKKEQLVGDAILPHYEQRLANVEEIIRRERLLTLPTRKARIRLASEAESAALPAPNMRPPRLIGNSGETGEFLLPVNVPAPPGSAQEKQKIDDFTHAAASWTLTAHEARPGHELQFDSIVERGLSLARAEFAFNSTNIEGWGLYAEHIVEPFMPLEGRLISLQMRLQRAARAFLDPELQLGKISYENARKVLLNDVCLSEAMANQEVERYTFRAPGQATSYFYGYTKLLALRADTEKALGAKFDAQKFHDFILTQGLLPPAMLRKAVMEQFVPSVRG